MPSAMYSLPLRHAPQICLPSFSIAALSVAGALAVSALVVEGTILPLPLADALATLAALFVVAIVGYPLSVAGPLLDPHPKYRPSRLLQRCFYITNALQVAACRASLFRCYMTQLCRHSSGQMLHL